MRLPWPSGRDLRNPEASPAVADLVAFHVDMRQGDPPSIDTDSADTNEKTMKKAISTAYLLASIRDVVRQSRKAVAYGVNTAMVLTNYEIGRLIVEHEQRGIARAEYAEGTLKMLALRLTAEFGKGYSVDNLERDRKFYLLWSKSATLSRISGEPTTEPVTVQPADTISATVSRKSADPFRLSWSRYVFLMAITDEDERRFYELEATNEGWSLRELRRQFDTSLYERLALSRDKTKVKALSRRGQTVETPHDVLKITRGQITRGQSSPFANVAGGWRGGCGWLLTVSARET